MSDEPKIITVHYYGKFADVELSDGTVTEQVEVCDHTSPVSGQYHRGPIPFVGPLEQEKRKSGGK